MSLKDIISPFYVWKRAFEKPYTTPRPLTHRPGARRYRGFHQNDIEKCIGCGSCEDICQNAAIDLVPVEGVETTKGDSGLRPRIDYGRCCWCGLCVDICTTDSLSLSNEYKWVDTDPEVFRFTPGVDKKSWDDTDQGYRRAQGYNLLHPERVPMEMIEPLEGIKSFVEVVKGYAKEQAVKEAQRCVECGLCVAACPAHMDIPDYIRAIREDKLDEALEILYRTNPMPGTCGRVCTHKCEETCSIGVKGEPLAIRWLKRFIVDQTDEKRYKEILGDEFAPNGKKVAIIGGGPGGLSAAYYLNRLGYDVTIFEKQDKAGGMIRYGVPEYRMPDAELDKDTEFIRSLGVDFRTGTEVGKDVSFPSIYLDYDALLIVTGLMDPYALELTGEDLPGVLSGVDLLDDIAHGKTVEVGEKVVVIGGGNVAFDAARTARRLGAEVTILYRRRVKDMPADPEEIHEAADELVEIVPQAIPVQIEQEEGKLVMVWGKAEMIDQGPGKRPRPKIIPGETYRTQADTIISAVGQMPDYEFLPKDISERLSFKKYRMETDEYGQTKDPKIFAAGDIVNNTGDAISAIADGYRAAQGIDRYLKK